LVTLVSQAYGSNNYEAVNFWTRVGMFLMVVFCIPSSILLIFSAPIFRHVFQQTEAVSEQASLFCQLSIPGLWFYSIFTIYQRRQFCENNILPGVVIIAVANVVNVFMNWYLIWGINLGFKGSPLATSFSRLFMLLCMLIYRWFIETPRLLFIFNISLIFLVICLFE